jgi:hypothetical protein
MQCPFDARAQQRPCLVVEIHERQIGAFTAFEAKRYSLGLAKW